MIVIFSAALYFLHPSIFAPKIKKIEVPVKSSQSESIDFTQNLQNQTSAEDSSVITSGERQIINYSESDTNTFAMNLIDAGIPIPVVIKEGEDISNQIKYFKAAMENYYSKNWNTAIDNFIKVIEFAGIKTEYTKQSYLKLAEIYCNIGKYNKSIEYYNYFISVFGENYEKIAAVYYNIAVSLYNSKNTEKSRYYFEKARAKNNMLAEAYIGLGNYYLDRREVDNALKIYAEGIKYLPKNLELNYNIGYIYFYFKDNIKSNPVSKTYFDAVINYAIPSQPIYQDLVSRAASYNYVIMKKNENYPAAYNYIVKVRENLFKHKELAEIYYLLKKEMGEVEQIFLEYIFNEEPNNSQNYTCLGDKFYNREQYEKALYYYYRGLKIDNKSVSAYFGIGRSAAKLNYYDIAYNAFVSIEKNVTVRNIPLVDWTGIPDDKTFLNEILKETYNYLGYLSVIRKEYPAAVMCYENSMKLTDKTDAPLIAELNYNIAVIYEQYIKDYKLAEKYYIDSIKLMPYTKKYEKAIGRFYFSIGDFNNAKDYLKRNADTVDDWYLLAYSLYKENEFEKSAGIFEKILKQSQDITILNASNKTLGNINFFKYKISNEKKDIDTAIKYFNNAIKFNDRDDVSFYNCGLSYYITGDYNRAINYFKSAIEINSTNSKYFSGIANCYYEKNLFELAENNYKKAIELDASNLEAHYNLTKIKDKRYE